MKIIIYILYLIILIHLNNKEGQTQSASVINNERELIIQKEELRLEIKNVMEKEISEINLEEIIEYSDSCIEFIKANYTYNKCLNLNEDNIYDILFFLEIYKKIKLKSDGQNIDNEFIKYKNKFISSIKNLNSINYNLFYDLISDKIFYEEIINILKSKSITDYLNNNYDEIDIKKNETYIECYSEEYKKLIEFLKDSKFFMNLFRLKYLPFGVKAYVNFGLKIFINSLYYEFNENITEDNKNIIFRAALKIIIVHEIMNILKYLKANGNFKEIQNSPRERETGKKLINYLFDTSIIKSIDLEEAKKINDINYWNNINLLKTIFHEKKESFEDHIDLYIVEEDSEYEDMKKCENNEDIGIDID